MICLELIGSGCSVDSISDDFAATFWQGSEISPLANTFGLVEQWLVRTSLSLQCKVVVVTVVSL